MKFKKKITSMYMIGLDDENEGKVIEFDSQTETFDDITD